MPIRPSSPRRLHDLVREALLAVELLGDRRDLLDGEVADGALDQAVLVGEVEQHGAATIPNDRSKFERLVRTSWLSQPPTRPALRERYDRRQREVVDTAARLFAAPGLPRDLDGRPDRGDRPRQRRALPLHREQGAAAAAHLRPADGPAARSRRDAIERGPEPAAERLRLLVRAWMRHVERSPRPHARLPAGAARCSRPTRAGRTCAASASASSALVDSLLRARRAATAPRASPTARPRCSACSGWSTTPRSGSAPDGRLSAEQIADRWCELLFGAAPA